MLHPSYSDLMKVVNSEVEEGETLVVNSRYSIVLATAKRARKVIDGVDTMVEMPEGKKALSIAIEEMNKGKLTITAEEQTEAELLENENS